jgi:CHAT domain-containing protein/Tfp pilus assembly protein PilF
MRLRRQSKKYSIWTVTLIGALALLSLIPPISAQTNPPSSGQSTELAEAERLNQHVWQLNGQGKQSEAIPLAKHALAIYEKVLGREHPDVADSLDKLAELYQTQKKYNLSEPLYQRALAIREKVLGREHPDLASSLTGLGDFYLDWGKYAQAEPLYQRSLAIREKVIGRKHRGLTTILNRLATLYQAQGKYTQAEQSYQRLLSINEKAETARDPRILGSLRNLSLIYQNQGNIPHTIEILNRVSNIEESKLASVLNSGAESEKRSITKSFSNATNRTLSLHIQAAPNNFKAARLALTTILRRKGRVLDVLTDSLQALRSRSNPKDQALLESLATTRSNLAALTFKGSVNTDEIATLVEQERELESSLNDRSGEFRTQNQPVTLESVQKLIPIDVALVEFVWYRPYDFKHINNYGGEQGDPSGVPRYVAYILHNQGEPKWVELGDAAIINKAVNEFERTIRLKSRSQMPFKTAARTLDKMLMQPVRKHLGNKRNILLSPDSQLNLIPFAALIDEKNQYLLENYEISYLSSGRDLIRLQADVPSKQNPVIVANPAFDQPGEPPVVNVATDNIRGISGITSIDLASLKYGAIEGTATEARAISAILPNAKILTGSEATENALKQLSAPNILHIATHGFFLKDVPRDSEESPDTSANNPLLRSGLALSGFNLRKSGNEDGVLTALEVAGLNLAGTKLVVLSACETGLGDVANGEGVYGLRRALAIAGAESQLITLWLVDDEATKDLMIGYYGRLQKNVGRSAALRQTQLEMLKNPKYQRPYYWAAFIPSGEWASLKVKS